MVPDITHGIESHGGEGSSVHGAVKGRHSSYHHFVKFSSERTSAVAQFVVLFLAAALVRCFLSSRFFGWEEGDYGNLMMIREVIDSGFTWFHRRSMSAANASGAMSYFDFHSSPRSAKPI